MWPNTIAISILRFPVALTMDITLDLWTFFALSTPTDVPIRRVSGWGLTAALPRSDDVSRPHTPSLNERVQELRYRAHKYLLTNSHLTAYIHGM
jgi:hypothetical protein